MYNRRTYGVSPRTIGGFIEDMFQNGLGRINEEVSAYAAPVNIQETDKSYELHLVAPGIKKEDFKISLDKNVLNISLEQKEENKDQQEGKWLRNEYRNRSFKRSFTLNDKIDATKISAKYADGILAVTLPKKEAAEQPVQDIAIN